MWKSQGCMQKGHYDVQIKRADTYLEGRVL